MCRVTVFVYVCLLECVPKAWAGLYNKLCTCNSNNIFIIINLKRSNARCMHLPLASIMHECLYLDLRPSKIVSHPMFRNSPGGRVAFYFIFCHEYH